MQKPLVLRLYLVLAAFSAPLWGLVVRLRLRRGLEDPHRFRERFGRATAARPEGKLIWFHAASVGEALSLVSLLRHLATARPDLRFLLTTTTRASADALERIDLPAGLSHQFLPADYAGAVRRFLSFWRPDALVVVEADFWPLLLVRTHEAGIPMLIVNAILTERRFRRRSRIAGLYRYFHGLFRRVLVQDQLTFDLLERLGSPAGRMRIMGQLKSASDPLPDAPAERGALQAILGDRPRWLAASTRDLEEEQLLEAHRLALAREPRLLLILAPRQVKLADRTESLARAIFPKVTRRSSSDSLEADTQVYIADTLGEMGLWFRLCPVTFMGNSMPVPGAAMTGKNPFEALSLGAMVLHGPGIDNFSDTYQRLDETGAALQVADAQALAQAVLAAQAPGFRAPYVAAAGRVVRQARAPLETAADEVLGLVGR